MAEMGQFKMAADNSWWVTTVQAGFELDGGGIGLSSDSFWSAVNSPCKGLCAAELISATLLLR
jgi:hypothetical protein